MVQISLPEGIGGATSNLWDRLIDYLAEVAEKHNHRTLSRVISYLSSEARLRYQIDEAIERAVRHWANEYKETDLEVVQSMIRRGRWWDAPELRKALHRAITLPGAYLPEELSIIQRNFAEHLSGFPVARTDKAYWSFQTFLVSEVKILPALQNSWRGAFPQGGGHLFWESAHSELKGLIYLPEPQYRNFIGRDKEIGIIKENLRPIPYCKFPVITIQGSGGIGKTALARHIVQYYVEDYTKMSPVERFDAIIWVTAQEKLLRSTGKVDVPDPIRSMDDIYERIALILEREDINQAREPERATRTIDALSKQRVLLVIDNLETITDKRIQEFLLELPNLTRAIVTTRHHIGIGHPMRLNELNESESLQLIREECTRKNVQFLTEDQVETLARLASGIALLIVYSIGKIAYTKKVVEVFEVLQDAKGEPLQFCYNDSVNQIRDQPAHKLLLAMALFRNGANSEALKYITGLKHDLVGIEDELVKLIILSLAEKQRGQYEMLGATRNFVLGEFENYPDFSESTRRNFACYFAQIVQKKLGSDYWAGIDTWKNYEFAKSQINNIIAAVDIGEKLEMHKEVRVLAIGVVHQLWRMGLWDKRIDILNKAIKSAKELDCLDDEALMRIDGLGWVYLNREEYDRALQEIIIGLAIGKNIKNDDIIALANRSEALIYIAKKGFPSAENVLQKALGLKCSPRVLCRLYLTIGKLKLHQEEYQVSEKYFKTSIRICRENNEMTGVAGGYLGLGELHIAIDAIDHARPELITVIGITDETRDIDLRARAFYLLGHVELKAGNIPEAEDYFDKCLTDFIRCGMKKDAMLAKAALSCMRTI